jgi:hypothetical protein
VWLPPVVDSFLTQAAATSSSPPFVATRADNYIVLLPGGTTYTITLCGGGGQAGLGVNAVGAPGGPGGCITYETDAQGPLYVVVGSGGNSGTNFGYPGANGGLSDGRGGWGGNASAVEGVLTLVAGGGGGGGASYGTSLGGAGGAGDGQNGFPSSDGWPGGVGGGSPIGSFGFGSHGPEGAGGGGVAGGGVGVPSPIPSHPVGGGGGGGGTSSAASSSLVPQPGGNGGVGTYNGPGNPGQDGYFSIV